MVKLNICHVLFFSLISIFQPLSCIKFGIKANFDPCVQNRQPLTATVYSGAHSKIPKHHPRDQNPILDPNPKAGPYRNHHNNHKNNHHYHSPECHPKVRMSLPSWTSIATEAQSTIRRNYTKSQTATIILITGRSPSPFETHLITDVIPSQPKTTLQVEASPPHRKQPTQKQYPQLMPPSIHPQQTQPNPC